MMSPTFASDTPAARAEQEFLPTRPARSETDRFAVAFAVVLGHEGGYTADPTDPGNWTGGAPGRGECRGTNWGISAASYPDLPIRALTPAQARAIYRRDYWDRVRGDQLPPSLALLVFDAAVNCGVGRAARWLQGVLGVAQDGAVGEVTLSRLRSVCEAAPANEPFAVSGGAIGGALRRRVERERSPDVEARNDLHGRHRISPSPQAIPRSDVAEGRQEAASHPRSDPPTSCNGDTASIEASVAALCAEFQAARLLYMVSLPTWQRFGGGWAKRLCRLPFEALRMETP